MSMWLDRNLYVLRVIVNLSSVFSHNCIDCELIVCIGLYVKYLYCGYWGYMVEEEEIYFNNAWPHQFYCILRYIYYMHKKKYVYITILWEIRSKLIAKFITILWQPRMPLFFLLVHVRQSVLFPRILDLHTQVLHVTFWKCREWYEFDINGESVEILFWWRYPNGVIYI